MIDIAVQLILNLNQLLFNSLGLTIIVIGVLSRALFYPFFANSIRYSKAMRELKPKIDVIKKKYKGDMRKIASEQSRLFAEAGVSPAAGAVGCLSIIIQIGVFILLFQSLIRVIDSGVDTSFLIWNLGNPDAYKVAALPIAIPGALVFLTALFSFLQSKMMMPPAEQTENSKKKTIKNEKPGIADALSGTQSQMVYIIPVVILVSGSHFPAGLVLYWFVSTLFGIIQQYNIAGLGGLEPWLKKLNLKK